MFHRHFFYSDNAAGGTGAGTSTAASAASAEPTVPKSRLDEEAQKRRSLEAEVGQLKSRLEESGKIGEELDRVRKGEESWKDKYKALEGQISRSSAARKAGIDDDEGVEIAHVLFQRQPADKRGTFEDWLGGLAKEGAEVPKPLQPYITKKTEGRQEAGGGGQAAGAASGGSPFMPRPAVPSGAPSGKSSWDPSVMGTVLEKARQGDPAAMEQLRKATGRTK